MIKKYMKKPVEVEVVQFTGGNFKEVYDFANGNFDKDEVFRRYIISTLEGTMNVNVGDYIIKGVEGEFYPCKKEIFEKTYSEVNITDKICEITNRRIDLLMKVDGKEMSIQTCLDADYFEKHYESLGYKIIRNSEV